MTENTYTRKEIKEATYNHEPMDFWWWFVLSNVLTYEDKTHILDNMLSHKIPEFIDCMERLNLIREEEETTQ